MTYDEVKTRISDLIGNPDTAQAHAVSLLEDLKTDYDSLDSMTAKVDEDATRIRDLQDTNQKLFLSVTGPGAHEPEEPKEPEPGIDWDNMFTDQKKE